MALSVNVDQVEQVGNSKVAYGNITFDNSYVTGGESLAITTPSKIERISVLTGSAPGYVVNWDKANQKVLLYRDNSTATAAALPEVANAVDLSAVTIGFVAWGQ